MLVKDLIKLDPKNPTPVTEAPTRKLFKMEAATSLFAAMDIFQEGDQGHIALIVEPMPGPPPPRRRLSNTKATHCLIM